MFSTFHIGVMLCSFFHLVLNNLRHCRFQECDSVTSVWIVEYARNHFEFSILCVSRNLFSTNVTAAFYTLSIAEDILKYIWYIGLVYFYPIYRDSGSCFWNLIFLCFHVISLNKNVVFSILHSLINCWHGFCN